MSGSSRKYGINSKPRLDVGHNVLIKSVESEFLMFKIQVSDSSDRASALLNF